MSTYVWSEIRDRAVESFGETPHGSTEEIVIDSFRRHPVLVIATIEGIAERKRLGKVKSGWAVLKSELARLETAEDVTASDESERTRAVARAEQWVRTCGIHLDRQDELEEELFGDFGRMRKWAAESEIRNRLVTLWESVRHLGVEIERAAEERGARWIEQRQPKVKDDPYGDIPF